LVELGEELSELLMGLVNPLVCNLFVDFVSEVLWRVLDDEVAHLIKVVGVLLLEIVAVLPLGDLVGVGNELLLQLAFDEFLGLVDDLHVLLKLVFVIRTS
jgi:hypothetical protein